MDNQGSLQQETLGDFRCTYYGSVTVKEVRANVVSDAVERVQEACVPRKASMVITDYEIRVLDRSKTETLLINSLTSIGYFGTHPGPYAFFVYIALSQAGLLLCHVFHVKKQVDELAEELKKAFWYCRSAGRVPVSLAPEKGTFTYDGFYLGTTPVTEYQGIDVVKAATEKVWANRTKLKQNLTGDPITLIISTQVVKIFNRSTFDIVREDFIKNVSFNTNSGLDGIFELFGYISDDRRLGVINCHVFKVRQGYAREISSTFSSVFKSNAEEKKKKSELTPLKRCQMPEKSLLGSCIIGKYVGDTCRRKV